MGLLAEMFVVGATNAIMGSLVSLVFMHMFSPDFRLETYTFWKQVFLAFFFTGVILHVLFEFSGANAWYCKYGNACASLRVSA